MKIKKTSLIGIILALALVIGTTTVFATNAARAAEENDQVDVSIAPKRNTTANTEAEPNGTPDNNNISNSGWVWPVEGCDTVVSLYGRRVHPVTGTTKFSDHIDIAGNDVEGASVYAALAGTVSKAESDDEQGNYIVISHDSGIETIYRHLGELQVSSGNPVAAGDTIGTVGSTGKVTGSCLSFCVHVNVVATNPLEYYTVMPADTADTTA